MNKEATSGLSGDRCYDIVFIVCANEQEICGVSKTVEKTISLLKQNYAVLRVSRLLRKKNLPSQSGYFIFKSQHQVDRIYCHSQAFNLLFAVRLIFLLKKTNVKVLNIHYPGLGYRIEVGIHLLAFWQRYIAKRRVIFTMHEFTTAHPVRKFLDICLAVVSSSVVLSNQTDKRNLQKYLPKCAISLLPVLGGFNYEEEVFVRRSTLHRESLFTAITFGFILRSKNYEKIIYSIHHLVSNKLISTNFKYKIVGRAPDSVYLAELRELCRELQLEELIEIQESASEYAVREVLVEADLAIQFYPEQEGVSLKRTSAASLLKCGIPTLTNRGPDTTQDFDTTYPTKMLLSSICSEKICSVLSHAMYSWQSFHKGGLDETEGNGLEKADIWRGIGEQIFSEKKTLRFYMQNVVDL